MGGSGGFKPPGGQITIAAEVVNYPGVEQISGTALTESMSRQAESFGAEFLPDRVEKLDLTDRDQRTSVEGLYAAGPGQPLGAETAELLRAIKQPVSLTCTLCSDLVMAAQRMAVENPGITAEAYDLAHFPGLRERYKVMSVPCLVINDTIVSYGKKNLREAWGALSLTWKAPYHIHRACVGDILILLFQRLSIEESS